MAGSETTATALTGAIYLLANNPRFMSKLQHEVRKTLTQENTIEFTSTAKLPYLCAVIQESLRLYPPGPNAQPRITPAQGRFVLGEHLPGNVSAIKKILSPFEEANGPVCHEGRPRDPSTNHVPQ